MDLLPDLLKEMEKKELKVYFYGGSPELIKQTAIHLKQHFPLLPIVGLKSPPFRELSKEEEEHTINEINSSEAQLVFVILGCPRQEKWMASMKGRINAVMVGVGGALPVLIGMQARAPKWMQRSGLEWFYRLAQEPTRLFKRYAITNSLFLYLLSKDFIRSLFLKKAY
jgi:N-acetylglucosaminyldiphosphoundecaprenol N-acetyl-beta-D-mannosaminyltransferase